VSPVVLAVAVRVLECTNQRLDARAEALAQRAVGLEPTRVDHDAVDDEELRRGHDHRDVRELRVRVDHERILELDLDPLAHRHVDVERLVGPTDPVHKLPELADRPDAVDPEFDLVERPEGHLVLEHDGLEGAVRVEAELDRHRPAEAHLVLRVAVLVVEGVLVVGIRIFVVVEGIGAL
jgi:hypothetical protein